MMAAFRRLLGLSAAPKTQAQKDDEERARQSEEIQQGLDEAKARLELLRIEAEVLAERYRRRYHKDD